MLEGNNTLNTFFGKLCSGFGNTAVAINIGTLLRTKQNFEELTERNLKWSQNEEAGILTFHHNTNVYLSFDYPNDYPNIIYCVQLHKKSKFISICDKFLLNFKWNGSSLRILGMSFCLLFFSYIFFCGMLVFVCIC